MTDQSKARKQKSRRLTEISQNIIKLVEEPTDEVAPSLVPGAIFEYLSRMARPEKCSKDVFFHSIIKLLKLSTSSTWVEVYLIKSQHLKSISDLKNKKKLLLNQADNLPSYALLSDQPILLTNPHTSTLYSRFPTKIHGFSNMTQQQIKPYSIACIPLYDHSNEKYAVAKLFNKVDNVKSQSFYTDDDVKAVVGLGRLIGELLNTRKDYFKLAKHNQGLISLVNEQNLAWKTANTISRRDIIHIKLLEILASKPIISKMILKMIKSVMDCKNATLYIHSYGLTKPLFSCGVSEDTNRTLKLIEYCSTTVKNLINIRDLLVEPLVNTEIPSDLNSCLLIPFHLFATNSTAVLCLLRESKEFSKTDQYLGENIVASLSNCLVSPETHSKLKIDLININNSLNFLRKFSLPEDINFDFYEFFHQIKVTLGKRYNLSSCTVYIANQSQEQLWTRNSNSASSLLFPYNTETLIGRTYEYGEIINLPNPKFFFLTDLDVFEDKFVISLPISSAKFKDPVIGVLVCTRKEKDFSELEMWLIEKYAENLADVLEQVFLSYLPECGVIDRASSRRALSKSPNSLFREVNKSKITFDIEGSKFCSKLILSEPSLLLAKIPQNRFGSIQEAIKIVDSSRDPQVFFESLPKLANCEKCAYYTICSLGEQLENVCTRHQFAPTSLQRYCIETKQLIYIKNSTSIIPSSLSVSPCQNDYLSSSKSSLLLLPIFNRYSMIVGLLRFEGFESDLNEEDIEYLNGLGFMCWLMCIDIESQHWQEIIEETRGEHGLHQWSKQLIEMANITTSKMLTCKNAIYQLVNYNSGDDVMISCFDVLCATMDCEYAEALIEFEESICRINKKGVKYIDLDENEYEIFKKLCSCEKLCDFKTTAGFDMCLPVRHCDLKGYLKLGGMQFKHTAKNLEDFFEKNEATLKELSSKIALVLYNNAENDLNFLSSLVEYIKMIALQYKPIGVNKVINSAAKSIVDGDRATYFAYKDSKLVAQDQGTEHEIPKSFALAQGKGIASHIFESRCSEIVQDAYSDLRFDPTIDKLTGYKTNSIICIPLVTKFQQFGVIEVLNKRSGRFCQKDLKLLEKFGELVCMILEIIDSMQITLNERFRLLAISNIMENYILVFNEHGNLIYINKQIDNLLGVRREQIMNLTYFAWLHGNKGLMEDLQAVFQNSSLSIRKTSQKFKTKKALSMRNGNKDNGIKIINYRVARLQNFSAECFSGVILIIEDATALELLHNQFKAVQKEIRILASPIGTETKLQKCITELTVMLSHVESQDMKDSLNEVILRLKEGGLKKPKLKIKSDDCSMGAITSILDMPTNEEALRNSVTFDLIPSIDKSESEVSLSALRNWDLNSFTVENQFDFILAMLDDFDLIQRYKVEKSILYNFSSRIREKCNHRNNPFHNFFHCFNVMHGVYLLLSCTPAGGFFNDLQIFSLLIAAMCHDVDHRGRGNMFEVHSRSIIATTYHDKSVLEQHHAAVTFFTLQEEGCDIFMNLTQDRYAQMRKMIITSILGTDMSKHLTMLENMTTRFKDTNVNPIGKLDKDCEKLAQLIIHAGDLCHPCKSYRIYEVWSMLVCEEFTDQYHQEVSLNLPITVFMKDLDQPKVYYANEIGFLNFVIRPLWECVNLFVSPHVNMQLENLNENITLMKTKLEEWKQAES